MRARSRCSILVVSIAGSGASTPAQDLVLEEPAQHISATSTSAEIAVIRARRPVLAGVPAACQILINPEQTFVLSRSGSTGTLMLNIPNDPSLAGLSFLLQAAEFTPGSLSLSAKATAVIGS